jgi:single-strand DNA-binding protein
MNKAILMGRLTKDPEIRYTAASNIPVCSFTLAIDRRFQKQGEEKQADFIPIVVWRNLAEFCSRYFQKGLRVAVIGTIQTRTYDDSEGKRHYVTEVIADEAYFADGKKTDDNNDSRAFGSGNTYRGNDNKPGSNTQQSEESSSGDGFYQIPGEDELPF